MSHFLFTSESVSGGHPDKLADQISDAILDSCLREDREAKVAIETMMAKNLVVLAGEITTSATVDYKQIALDTIQKTGYTSRDIGLDFKDCEVILSISKQSRDIALGVNEGEGVDKSQGAGDQGLMFGFACDETAELMPLPIMLAHKLIRTLQKKREEGTFSYLRPDAKSQVTVEYDEEQKPVRVDTVVISTQHGEEVLHEDLIKDMMALTKEVIPSQLLDEKTLYYINPTGRFVIGGPAGDCGLTGRKIIVDSYGGMGRHGGGAFSGKDPSKVDRSGAYAARYVAKNIVAARLATRCEVQISYAIGISKPISLKVDTFGTGTITDAELVEAIYTVFDLSPRGIIKMLDLKRPIYFNTAVGGHFGRHEAGFTWEETNRVSALLDFVKRKSLQVDPIYTP